MTDVGPALCARPETGTSELAASIRPPRLDRAFWGVMAAFLVHGLVVSTWVSRIAAVKSSLHLSDGVLGLSLLGTAIGVVLLGFYFSLAHGIAGCVAVAVGFLLVRRMG